MAAQRSGLTQALELTREMADDIPCTFCGQPVQRSLVVGATWQRFDCVQCGRYLATPGALHWIKLSDQAVRDKLSCKARSAPAGTVLLVSDEHIWLNTQESHKVYSEYVASSSGE